MLTRAISDALRDHRANPVNVCGVLMSRRDAICLARIETLATVNPSAVADSRGARPSGRTEGHAPAASLNHALHGFSESGLSAALFDPFHSPASSQSEERNRA